MRRLQHPRTIPDSSPAYFVAWVPGHGKHNYRIPRPSIVARLLKPLIGSGLWRINRDDIGDIDEVKAELVEEAVGAAIGICWRHRELEMETKRRDFERGVDGLMEFGAEVMGELYEAGYSQEQVTTLGNEVITKLMIAIPSSPQEVQERVDFTVPRTGSETSLTST